MSDPERTWESGWDGHRAAQLRRFARLPLRDKLAWLEQAHGTAVQMGARTTPLPRAVSNDLVLVAEDDPDERELLVRILTGEGHRVETASDGLEAVIKAAGHHPAVIVMRLDLPALDGWEAIRRLKAGPATRDIPVIALTAQAGVDERAQAEGAGCAAYLGKPFTREQLVTHVRELLRD